MNDHSGFRDLLFDHAVHAAPELYVQTENGVQCLACANRCKIADDAEGACRMRFMRRGEFHVPGGYVAGLNVDPIEKKPFFNVLPGRDALSFGMLGCNFHCSFCQNWQSSQALKDPDSMGSIHSIRPEHLADMAVEQNVPVIVSTYNEPLISADWSAKIFARAKENGILCGFVSNGYATPEAVNFIRPFVDIFKVDLKCFDADSYLKLGGNLNSVLETITALKEKGVWVEIVTLLVPGFNDSDEQLRGMTSFISGLSRDVPWHVTAFHPDYKLTDARPTKAEDIERAAGFGKEVGLRYIYAGNLPGRTQGMENTYCPNCNSLLIERVGFTIIGNRMSGAHCPDCDAAIPGVWEEKPPKHASHSGAFRRVL